MINRDMVCIAAVDWDGIQNRSQQLMKRFSQRNRILYVNPPASWLSPLRDPAAKNKKDAWKRGVTPVTDRLYVMDLPMIHPFGSRLFGLNAVNQKTIAATVKAAVDSLGMENVILWTYLHTSADLVGKLGESMVIYDCVDDHGAFPGHNPRVVASMENRLIQRADIVFASARHLAQRCRQFSDAVFLVPNGADVTHFKKAQEDGPIPEDLASVPHPVVGYIGYVHDWFNQAWIRQAAQNRPDWSFVIIGPVHTDVGTLEDLSNVHFLGEKKYEVLPDYLRQFAVCVIPFVQNELTRSVNPIKLYEYLAAGKPVVASRLPELEAFQDCIVLVDQAGEFEAGISQMIDTGNTPDQNQSRQDRVVDQSWDQRIQTMESVIDMRKE